MSQTPSLPGNNEDTTNDHLSMNIHNSLYIFFFFFKFKKIAACTAIFGELVAKQRGIYNSFHTHKFEKNLVYIQICFVNEIQKLQKLLDNKVYVLFESRLSLV